MARLKPKQIKALAALCFGATIAEAAIAAGCTPQTVDNWLRSPEFSAEYDRLLNLHRDRVQGMLASTTEHIRKVLVDAMLAEDDAGQPAHSIRLRGAELAAGAYERISKRGGDGQAPTTGPLIILPGGAQPMALLIGAAVPAAPAQLQVGQESSQAGQAQQLPTLERLDHPPVPRLPAGAMALETGVVAAQPQAPMPASGLPQWWQASKPKSK